MSMTGADIPGLLDLSNKFTSSGSKFSERAEALMKRAQTAIQEFESTLSDLQSQTNDLSTQTVETMSLLSAKADGVEWTGSNRDNFNADKGTFETTVKTSVDEINNYIQSVKAEVENNFNATIEQFGDSVKKFGESVNDNATQFSTTVQTQSDNLEQAANVGWTSA